jgi:CRISPR system Cascade subunit CasA
MEELDPFFIEVCRRVRLTATEQGRLAALARPANAPRVASQALKGNLGDPWVPINQGKGDRSSLTVSGNGFDYRLAQRILCELELKRPLSMKELPGEHGDDSEIHMAVLVRGQGKTEGLHERVIPLPGSVAAYLSFDEEEPDSTLADLSQEMVEFAGEARKVLRQAVLVYLQGPENPNFKKPDANPTIDGYDRRIDEEFFNHLFETPNIGSDEVIHRWQMFLRDEALRRARDVWHRTLPPSARREKARVASEAVLFGGLRKRLPEAFPENDSKEVST